jgi:hypothetical protein
MATKAVNIRVPIHLYEYLAERAKKEHRTLTGVILDILLTAKEQDEEKDIRKGQQ